MSFETPSLWDNTALEDGLRMLTNLRFEEAAKLLGEAKNIALNHEIASKAIAACHFWEPKIKPISQKEIDKDNLRKLLADYLQYAFIPQLESFKKRLLLHIVQLWEKQPRISEIEITTIFDLLLQNALYKDAKSFISINMKTQSNNHRLLYMLGQAEWRNEEKANANKNYLHALLYCPDKKSMERIENDRLKKLAQSHHPAMAPSYAWIEGLLPFVTLDDELSILDKEHQKAIDSYRYLKQSDKALQNKEDVISHRKRLKATAPGLFDAYMNLLHSG